jgi:hypothetical protein
VSGIQTIGHVEFWRYSAVVLQETAKKMRNVLLALIVVPLVGACTATVRSGPSRPAPVTEYREPPPPPPPPPPREHEHERHHDRAPEPRVIQGRILDAVTKQPIDRASIDVTVPGVRGEIATVQTGPDGRYRTTEIPRGQFGIRVRREGYDPINRQAEMADGVAHLDFELVPRRR